MSDSPSILPSPSGKNTSPISSLFASPKLLMGFSDSEAAMSPTSILETKPFSVIGNPERCHRKPYWGNGDSTAIGLGLVDALTREKSSEKKSVNQSSSRMVLFGSQLKIQIPPVQSSPVSPTGSVESPQTPIEFGFKNRNLQLALRPPSPPRLVTGCLSPSEMELSEDYTCVISYGPNPKKTHIFDNCVVESCGDGFVASKRGRKFSGHPFEDFLSFCHACKKSLAQGKDIFMYRGERAFCSRECRQQEMMSDDEGTENCFQEVLNPL